MSDRYNASGCRDNTANKALNNIKDEDRKSNKKAHDTIKIVKDLIDFCGYDLLNRIAIKDKETGKEYR